MEKTRFDVAIIGGGVVGCAIARELSRYTLDVLLLEKECDVAMGTSGRNSGVSHAGFYVPVGTMKAKLNIIGHEMIPGLCAELDVPFKPLGKIVVAKEEREREYLYELKEKGEKNGCKHLRIIGRDEIKRLEPNIEGIEALHSPTTAVLDPFQLTIGLAENAVKNGVSIKLDTKVEAIQTKENGFTLVTSRGVYDAGIVVNSAGLYSDRVASMVGIDDYRIHPCRGEYHILDKSKSGLINGAVYPVPPRELGGLGVHLTPTTDGNIMLGPSAEYIEDNDDTANTSEVMDKLFIESMELLPMISRRDVIRSFAGVRPKLICEGAKQAADFVIQESRIPGFINLIGIESPGLTAAPAIAEKVAGIIGEKIDLRPDTGFDPVRRRPKAFNELPMEEKARLVREDPDYGIVICRCQTITRREIIDALENPLGATGVSCVSRRCRAGLGRCQSGFCLPKIIEIIKELRPGIDEVKEVNLKGEGSEILMGRKGDMRGGRR